MSRSCVVRCSLLAASLVAAPGLAAVAPADVAPADVVVAGVDAARAKAGVGPLERRPALDAIALDYARTVAGLPHRRRLAWAEPVGELLDAAGIAYRFADLQFQMVRGYDDPGDALLRSWSGSPSGWARVLESRLDAVGAATWRDDEGWVVFAAVLVDDPPRPGDVGDIAVAVAERADRVRRKHGLAALEPDARLAAVARGHSEDMARRGYLDHVDPDGHGPGDRVDAAGIGYRLVGENIVRTRGADDAAAAAVRSWLDSPGHRANLLNPAYSRGGVGVAIAADGTVYVTQLYLEP